MKINTEPTVDDEFRVLDLDNSRIGQVRITVADAKHLQVVTLDKSPESGQFAVSSVVNLVPVPRM